MKHKYLADMQIGLSYVFEKLVTNEDVEAFAQASGDNNPLHLDENYAKNTIFGERVAHGILTASHISAAVVKFLGPGWIYINQTLQFRAPVRIGETVNTCVEVRKIIPEKSFVELTTECSVDKTIVITGLATIRSPDQ